MMMMGSLDAIGLGGGGRGHGRQLRQLLIVLLALLCSWNYIMTAPGPPKARLTVVMTVIHVIFVC